MLAVEVGPVDVAHTRYAISPLGEAMNALRVAAGKQPAGPLRPWAERIAPRYEQLLRERPAVRALTTLLRRGGYNADFIHPASGRRRRLRRRTRRGAGDPGAPGSRGDRPQPGRAAHAAAPRPADFGRP
ncbi:hypothetical protein ACFQ0B_53905 [Nonomuraea thailandensis]